MAHCHRWRSFHLRIRAVGGVGSGHPVAALLSGVDIPRRDLAGPEKVQVGLFRRHRGGGDVGLHERFCQHVFHERAAPSRELGSYRSPNAARPTARDPCLGLESHRDYRLHLGLFAFKGKAAERLPQVRGRVCSDDDLLRGGHGDFPAAVLAANSRDAPSPLAKMVTGN